MGVSPHDIMLSTLRKLKSIWLEQITQMLKKKIIPVVHGDVLIDENQGVSIFSCDKALQLIAINLDLSLWKEVFFVSVGNFPGVLDGKNRVIKKLTCVQTGHIDVTGGMRTKNRRIDRNGKIRCQDIYN